MQVYDADRVIWDSPISPLHPDGEDESGEGVGVAVERGAKRVRRILCLLAR